MPAATPQQRSRRIRFSASALLLAGLLVFTAAAWVQYASMATLRDTLNLRAQARETRRLADHALSLLKDVETGQRGYLLTRDTHFLHPYDEGISAIPAVLGQMEAPLRQLGLAQDEWREAQALYRHRLDLARRNVELARQGRSLSDQEARVETGRQAMDAVRLRFTGLDERLRVYIETRNLEAQAAMDRTRWLTILLSALGVGLILTAGGLLLREQRRREAAEAALAAANAGLEEQVADRTAELLAARLKLENYVRDQDQRVEAERRRLAREVHDRLGQVFTAMKLGLARLAGADPGGRQELDALMDDGIDTSRRIAFELRPAMLEDLGLGVTLEQYARGFCLPAGLVVEVAIGDAERLGKEQALQLYRIAQEALTNVLRHAEAKRARIRGAAEDRHYVLEIEDDGRGLDAPPGLGMTGMAERARLAGGALETGRAVLGGARLRVTLPLETTP